MAAGGADDYYRLIRVLDVAINSAVYGPDLAGAGVVEYLDILR